MQAGQSGQRIAVMVNCNALYLLSIFHTSLQPTSIVYKVSRMLKSAKLQGANAGLAYPLDEPLAQNPLPPRNSTAPVEPITRLKAIIILLDQREDDIFSYLNFARCHGSFSHDQYLAVCALKGCSDAEIRTWLKEARKLCETIGYRLHLHELTPLLGQSEQRNDPHDDTTQAHGFSYLSPSGQVGQGLHVPVAKAYPNLVQAEGSRQSASITSAAHSARVLDNTETSQGATKAANLYWCTIYEDRRPLKNNSDWRKHEKGHVETYVCMLTGPVDDTDGCVTCSLCGLLNPNQEHLSAHNTHTCGPGVPGSFFCKRRADLVRHTMKCHRIQTKARAEAIADKWKETTKKQAWSCGFCVCFFSTFSDRLKHIATHFERGQTLDEWDTTNVIEGLFLQPGLISFWERPLDWRSSKVIWKKDAVKQVQNDLEFGPSDPAHAEALVRAVHNARLSDGQMPNNDRQFPSAPNYEAQETSAFSPRSGHASTTNRVFQSSSYHEPTQFVNPAELYMMASQHWAGTQ